MNFAEIDVANNRVVQFIGGFNSDEDIAEHADRTDYLMVATSLFGDPWDYAYSAEIGVYHSPRPARPSQFHTWDGQSWIERHTPEQVSVIYQHLVRTERDKLLEQSDWRVTKAMETGVPLAPEWVAYRQALRDITKQADLQHVVWPVAPA